MSANKDDGSVIYRVVRNEEQQYSIWPADRELPSGWDVEGTAGSRQDCLDQISQNVDDLRPLSLRRQMDQM